MRDWTFKDNDFSDLPVYDGADLGVTWTVDKLSVRVWAPTALELLFRLYRSAEATEPEQVVRLELSVSGTWVTVLNGDYEKSLYTFQVRDKTGWLNECPDIGAIATGVNGTRGMILNRKLTNPDKWEDDRRCSIKFTCVTSPSHPIQGSFTRANILGSQRPGRPPRKD
jgi:pullulanase